MLRRTLSILSLALVGLTAQATHMSGGEIYWECLGNNNYRIRLLVYRDCAGINVDPSYNLDITSPCGNRTLNVSTNGGTELSQLCDLELPNSTCNGGTLPGIQQYIYTGTINLPPCNSWRISWTNIFRNDAIVNLTAPGTRQMFIQAVMNNSTGPCNDSPTFTNAAIPYVCLGYPISYSYGAVDGEADSLSYSLIGARMLNGNAIPYVAPFTPAQPITGLTLDPATGLINFTLSIAGNWVVVVLVTEYDANGNVKGTVMRDMQFVAFPCSNVPPDAATGLVENISGTATQTGPRAVSLCESGNVCFDMEISDANANNVLTATSNVLQNLPGATFSYTGTNPITAHVCWTAQPGTAGFYPFIVNVSDGACPIPAFQTYVYTVRVIPGLAAYLAVVNESCLGSGDGSVEVVVTTGTGPFSYTWSTGSSEAMVFGEPGEYTVEITDDNGCISPLLSDVLVPGPVPPQATTGADLLACNGAANIPLPGTVTNAAGGAWSNGSGTLGGSWPNNTYTPSNAEFNAGGLDLVLTTTGDGTCPPATDTLHITISNSFVGMTITPTDALCNSGSTGSATVAPVASTFSFVWNDPAAQTTATANMLSAGPVSVLVSDGLGCDTTLTTVIGQPTAVSIASLVVTDEACSGTGNGTIIAAGAGGTAPYTYTWSNGETGPVLTAGNAGTYTVSVTDARGCTPATGTATIGTTGLPNIASAGADPVSCNGSLQVALGGSVTNATSGSWTGGTGAFSGTWPTISYTPGAADISAGAVTLTLTTIGNTTCPPATDQLVLDLPNSFDGVITTATDAHCFGTLTGTAAVTPAITGASYSWNDPSAQTTATATGLAAGNYTVIIMDSFDCTTSLDVAIDQPAAISLLGLLSTNETCAGLGNGLLVANASGGTAPYAYTWNTGATGTTLNAGAGTYSVNVTDANGCTPASGTGTIAATGQPNTANAGNDLIGCMNAYPISVSGSVQNATGGSWSGGFGPITGTGLNIQYSPTVNEVLAGGVSLVLTTTGNTSCPPASDTVRISLSNAFLNAQLSTTDVLCNGSSDGMIAFSPNNVQNTYLWNDPSAQTSAGATGLSAGNYSVLVTDVLGCDTSFSATITDPPMLLIDTVIPTAVLCADGTTGAASLQILGGTPNYSVLWSNGQTGISASGLTAGIYTAQVTDANGCSAQAMTTITQPEPIEVAVLASDTVCANAPVQLIASASGGAGDFTFNWGGMGYNDTVQMAFSTAQTILLSVVDGAGCPGPITPVFIAVRDLNSATLNTYGDTTVCFGGSGTVGASLSGYAGTYTFSWSPIGNSGPGPHTVPINTDQVLTVTVTDQCGQILTSTVGLGVDVAPAFDLPQIIAEGCAPLTVHYPVLNLGNVVYHWNLGNGNTSNMPAPVVTYPAGNYVASLTVTTPLGCMAQSTGGGSIHSYPNPSAQFTASTWSTDIDHPIIDFTDQSTGAITSYSWIFGEGGTSSIEDPSYNFMDVGTFDVELTVTDTNGCTSTVDHPITISPVYDVEIPTAFTPSTDGPGSGQYVTGDLSNDVFYPFVRFVTDFRMRIFNRWGELIFESTDLKVGWDGYYRGLLSPQDVYVVQTWYKFVDGKQLEKLSDLTLFR